MTTQNYQLFFVIGLSARRPYNSLEVWPSASHDKMRTGDDLSIQTISARQIDVYKA